MISFDPQDKSELFRLLIAVPTLEERRERKAILIRAGLEELISHMQLDGPSNIAIPLMISHFISYGKMANGRESLGLFLQTVKEDVGLEDRQFLETLLNRYGLA